MKISSQSITATASLILAGAVSFFVIKSSINDNQAAIASELVTLNTSVDQLTVTLQRYNTTTVQLDYLQNEIGRLEMLDKSLRARIQMVKAEEIKSPTADGEKRIAQLGQAQANVQKKLKSDRESMLRIIGGLERLLQSSKASLNSAESGTAKTPPLEVEVPDDLEEEGKAIAE